MRRPDVHRGLVVAVVGLFAWSVLGLAGVGIASDPFAPDTTTITADFPRTVGLYEKSRVRVQGIDSGWVTAVEPGLDGVKVTIEIDGVAVAADAIASLNLKSMIGERYVELSPIWDGKGARLESGATIPRDRVHVPAEISEVLDQFTELAEKVDKKAVGKFVSELAGAVDGRQGDIAAMVANFGTTGRTLAARADEIDASIGAMQRVMGTLADRDDRMVELMRSAAAVSDALLAQEGALGASISGVDRLLGEVKELTVNQKEKLVTLLDGLDRVGRVLAKHDGDFGQVVDLLPHVAFGYLRAVDNDGEDWYTINYPMGLLFLPSSKAINGGGGVGSDRDDHRFVPGIDHSGNPIAQLTPGEVDATGYTGDGPLLPSFNIGTVCHDEGCEG